MQQNDSLYQWLGEIEVFVTRAGHTTGWHTDYQENFTVQLRGRKRWLLARSDLDSPLRAFTPHYKGDNDIEEQLKCHRLQVPAFGERTSTTVRPPAPQPFALAARPQPGRPAPALTMAARLCVQIPQEYDTVEIGPGGTLYHPAGIWHQVEATADSISVNFSVIGCSWADVTATAVRQLLWTAAPLRSPAVVDTYAEAAAQVARNLAAAKALVNRLQPNQLLPPCLLPCAGRRRAAVTVRPDGSQRDGAVLAALKAVRAVDAAAAGPQPAEYTLNPLTVVVAIADVAAFGYPTSSLSAVSSDEEDGGGGEDDDGEDEDGEDEGEASQQREAGAKAAKKAAEFAGFQEYRCHFNFGNNDLASAAVTILRCAPHSAASLCCLALHL